MDAHHIKLSCGNQYTIFHLMGIGFGMNSVTWRNIEKSNPPTSNLHVGHKIQLPILWV